MRTVRSVSALRLAALLALAALAPACASAPPAPTIRRERAEVRKLEIAAQDFESFEPLAQVNLPPGTRPVAARWEVVVGDDVLGTGTSPLSGEIGADAPFVEVRGRSPYSPPEKFAEILDAQTALPILFRGTIDAADGTLHDFSNAGQVRTPRVPKVAIRHIEAAIYADAKEIDLIFFPEITNPNPFELQVEALEYDLSVDGQPMIEKGRTGKKERIPSSSAARLELPLGLTEKKFPGVVKHLKGQSGLTYKLAGELVLPVGRVPVELEGPIPLAKPSED